MEEKKFQSLVRRVVFFPLSVLLIIMILTIVSCFISFFNMQQKMIDSNINSLQITLNQLDNLLSQIDHSFVQYWSSNESYSYLNHLSADTPKENYLIYESDTTTWLSNQASAHKEVEGAFAYYSKLDLILFRGSANFPVHRFIEERIEEPDAVFNHWYIATVADTQYLINLKNYGDFYGGVWMPLSVIYDQLGISEKNFMGTVYIMDSQNNNTVAQEEINTVIKQEGISCDKVRIKKESFHNYNVTTNNISMGTLIPQSMIFSSIPTANKIIFLVAFLSLFLVPIVILWLQRKIAMPVRDIDKAMEIIGEGDMDYRIPLTDKKYYDEFDRLIFHFNKMMDELNDLEFHLYKTKIKEQRTELKYISQQIRPHFILNALNIIYTYEDDEFPLVKKMVLYLTDYFRYIVNLQVDFVELVKEMRHAKNYLNIQKERYPEQLDFFVEWEARVNDCLIPPLIIQTFVENCIKYGLKNSGRTFIYVLASREDEKLKLMVADTGNGFPQAALENIETFIRTREPPEGLGVGIQNAVERMDILYDCQIELKVRNALSGGAIVEIYLPLAEIYME